MRGIIPRVVEQILSQASTMQSQQWTFTIKASFLKIYNEELWGLLILIKRNADGRSFVDGINIQVYSEDDIKQIYAYFQKQLSFNFCATRATCY